MVRSSTLLKGVLGFLIINSWSWPWKACVSLLWKNLSQVPRTYRVIWAEYLDVIFRDCVQKTALQAGKVCTYIIFLQLKFPHIPIKGQFKVSCLQY